MKESTALKQDAVDKRVEEEKHLNNLNSGLQRENEYDWQMKHTSLVNLILEELKQLTKQIRSKLDQTGYQSALKSATIRKFIPQKLFLSSIETFKLTPETRDQ